MPALIALAVIGIAAFCVVCNRETPQVKTDKKGVYKCLECGEENRPIES
jgi:DNA-directed RNA polymerase subunit RPC12/RpoP